MERGFPLTHAHDHDGIATDGRRVPTPSAGWTGTVVRLLFGVIWATDAYLKWQPGYRSTYISNLKQTAQGQPAFLNGVVPLLDHASVRRSIVVHDADWGHGDDARPCPAAGSRPPGGLHSLDKFLERRLSWWRFVAEPHVVDRVHGARAVEPVVVGEVTPGYTRRPGLRATTDH